jgi:hypothetical protein
MKIKLPPNINIETPRWMDVVLLLIILAITAVFAGLAWGITLTFISVVLLFGIGWLIYRRYRQIHQQGQQELKAADVGRDSYDIFERLGFYSYQGFKWEVVRKRDRRSNGAVTHPDAIWTVGPPRCPICEVELKQQKSFWHGFIWQCIRGHFKRRHRDNFKTVTEDVRKFVCAELEQNPH